MSRLFVVGLDGADWTALEAGFDRGLLPTLRSLLDGGGTSGRLRSTIPPVTPPAWTSFVTGVDPGSHGVFAFRKPDSRSYRGIPVSAVDRRHPTLLARLAACGRRVVSVTVPFTYPAEVLPGGCMVSGFGLPDSRKEAVTPHSLFGEIVSEVGSIPSWPVPPSVDAYRERTGADIERRFKIGHLTFERYQPDVFLLVLSETDHAAHYFWRADEPPEELLNIYQQADAEIGRFFDRYLEADDAVLIMSDHGTGPGRGLRVHVNGLLLQLGLLAARGRRGSSAWRRTLHQARATALGRFPSAFRRLRGLAPVPLSRVAGAYLHDSAVEWSRTIAYCSGPGGVRLNLRDREPAGSVRAGDYERVREEVRQALLSLTGPDQEPLFSRVLAREELYEGPFMEAAPDLLTVEADPGWETVGSFDLSLPPFVPVSDRRLAQPESVGTHRPDGVYILRDPLLRQISSGDPVDIQDILPAVLGGRGLLPISTALGERWYGRGQDGGPVSVPGQSVEQELSESEQAAVEEHLRSLGYVD